MFLAIAYPLASPGRFHLLGLIFVIARDVQTLRLWEVTYADLLIHHQQLDWDIFLAGAVRRRLALTFSLL